MRSQPSLDPLPGNEGDGIGRARARARIVIRDFNKEIADVETGSIYTALSADSHNKHGYSASFIAYDELAQASRSPTIRRARNLDRSQEGAVGLGHLHPDERPEAHHVGAHRLCEGRERRRDRGSVLCRFIYEVPEGADIWDEQSCKLANPALDDFRSLEELRSYAAKAKRLPAREAVFHNLYLNQRIDRCRARATTTAATDRRVGVRSWRRGRRCGRPRCATETTYRHGGRETHIALPPTSPR
jgi:hypothetical protein